MSEPSDSKEEASDLEMSEPSDSKEEASDLEMSEPSDSKKKASDLEAKTTSWSQFVEELTGLYRLAIEEATRFDHAYIDACAEYYRTRSRSTGDWMTRVGETMAEASQAVSPGVKRSGTAPTPQELSVEMCRAYLNAWIGSGEALRSSFQRFLRVYEKK
jgi:hypothetical protein